MSFLDPFELSAPEVGTPGTHGLAHGVSMSIADTLGSGASRDQGAAGLDKNARYVVPGFRENRHERRKAAKWAIGRLLDNRVQACGRKFTNAYELAPGLYGVPVVFENGTTKFHGVFTCSNKNLCPDCTARADAATRETLAAVIRDHEAGGGFVALLTLTSAHNRGESLRSVLERVLEAGTATLSPGGKQLTEVKALGFLGGYKSLEVNHSYRNGWHPHLHVILFFDSQTTDPGFCKIVRGFRRRWIAEIEKRNSTADMQNQDIRIADEGVGEYLNKRGVSWEATARTSKQGRKGSRTFFQIAEDYAEDQFPPDADLIREYASVMQGRKRITPFGEVRKMYAGRVKTEWDDEFHGVENETREEPVEICCLEAEVFQQCVSLGIEDRILDAAECGGIVAVRAVLREHGINHGLWPPGVAKRVKRPKRKCSPHQQE